jgi:hypothetical protein
VVPDRLRHLLSLGAVVLPIALVATAALTEGHGFALYAGPIGVLAGGVLALRRAPFPVVVIAAAATTALLRWCGVRPLGHRHRPPAAPPAAPPAGRPHVRTGVPVRPARPHLRPPGAHGRRHRPGHRPRPGLSYPRAEHLFKTASAALDPHGAGWTLHQLRHSALTHLAAAGRTATEPQAKSRHQHLGSLGFYVKLGEETSARITAEHDPSARRRPR